MAQNFSATCRDGQGIAFALREIPIVWWRKLERWVSQQVQRGGSRIPKVRGAVFFSFILDHLLTCILKADNLRRRSHYKKTLRAETRNKKSRSWRETR